MSAHGLFRRSLMASAALMLLGSVGCDTDVLNGWLSAEADRPSEPAGDAAGTQPLIANAGGDITVVSEGIVVLAGTAEHAADDVALLDAHWMELTGSVAKITPRRRVVLGQKIVFKAPVGPRTLVFRFQVSDRSGNSTYDECTVQVLAAGQQVPGGSPDPGGPKVAVIVSGSNADLTGGMTPYLTDYSADFLMAGVDQYTDVVEILGGTGAVPGVYGITMVTTSDLYLDADAGNSSTADLSYRVLRP